MPNSAACLIELVVSPPALARPMILAFDACACSRNEREVLRVERVAHLAEHLAAVLEHDRLGVALERVAEGVVGGQEEPGVAARLHDRAAGAVGEHPGVVGPVDGVGRAGLAGQVRGRRAGDQERLALVLGDLVDGERHARVRHVDDDVDLVDVVPLARDRRSRCPACSGGRRRRTSTLMPRFSMPESSIAISRRRDGAGAGKVGVEARHVGQHADLDGVVRRSAPARAGAERRGDGGPIRAAFGCVHGCSSACCSARAVTGARCDQGAC